MKIRNKHTGETIDVKGGAINIFYGEDDWITVTSLNQLAETWEDYEEPKNFYWVDYDGKIRHAEIGTMDRTRIKEIGNYFDTREEAEKAVEKLKALNKLCRKGFEFHGVEMFGSGFMKIEASIPINEKTTLEERSDITDSLYLLFGGEE